MILLAVLAVAPFLLTPIPPLTDVPGHIGQFSIQTATAVDGLSRYFSFRWALTLNLASDLIVQALHSTFGVIPVVWTLCAVTPALTAIGIVALARATNRQGAYAVPWALLFVFNSSFLWGFLNYTLVQALALIALAGWIALETRRRFRAIIFLLLTPALLIGHGVAGAAAVTMIVGYTGWNCTSRASSIRTAATAFVASAWPPLVASAATLIVWRLISAPEGGVTLWLLRRKSVGIIHMLQDQNKLFDVASVACALLVWLTGWFWGARLGRGPAGAVILIIALFLSTPSLLSGSDEVDTRLAPLIPMLAFAMQDWSNVSARRRRAILAAGLALLTARFAVTTISFAGYARRYDHELVALNHVAPGSRVLTLAQVECDGWRMARLEHLGNLATTFRGAWVNAHWSVSGLHLLQIRYRPSSLFYNDPSEMVFPPRCVSSQAKPYGDYRASRTVMQIIPMLPLAKVDYVWLVGTHLTPGYRNTWLRRIWSNDDSELYATRSS